MFCLQLFFLGCKGKGKGGGGGGGASGGRTIRLPTHDPLLYMGILVV